jgi:hypothetical protein
MKTPESLKMWFPLIWRVVLHTGMWHLQIFKVMVMKVTVLKDLPPSSIVDIYQNTLRQILEGSSLGKHVA